MRASSSAYKCIVLLTTLVFASSSAYECIVVLTMPRVVPSSAYNACARASRRLQRLCALLVPLTNILFSLQRLCLRLVLVTSV